MVATIKRYFTNEVEVKELLNLILIISLFLSFLSLLLSVIIKVEGQDPVIMLLVFLIMLSCFLANNYGKKNIGFLVYSLLAPISNGVVILSIGSTFEPCVNASAIICFVFMFYNDKPRRMLSLIAYNVALTTAILIYITIFNPLSGYVDLPYDEVVSFLFSTFWILLVLFLFKNRNTGLIKSLEKKNQELVDLTNELEYFNYMATHDFKAPIKNTKSFLKLIKDRLDEKEDDKIHNYFNYALEGVNSLEKLTHDILSLGSINNSLKKAEKIPVDLNKIVVDVEKLLISSYVDAKIVCDDLPIVNGNEIEFFQLFANLIENGIKYNRRKQPQITIRNQSTGNDIKLTINDNGIGIAKENVGKIFDFFTRLHSSSEFEGTGLGLGLCKKIVKAYDGEVKLDSILDVGSTFTIYLPQILSKEI